MFPIGELTLLEALTRSYNQATVRLGLNIGVHQLINKLQQFGITAEVKAVPSTLLGAVELTPIEVDADLPVPGRRRLYRTPEGCHGGTNRRRGNSQSLSLAHDALAPPGSGGSAQLRIDTGC